MIVGYGSLVVGYKHDVVIKLGDTGNLIGPTPCDLDAKLFSNHCKIQNAWLFWHVGISDGNLPNYNGCNSQSYCTSILEHSTSLHNHLTAIS